MPSIWASSLYNISTCYRRGLYIYDIICICIHSLYMYIYIYIYVYAGLVRKTYRSVVHAGWGGGVWETVCWGLQKRQNVLSVLRKTTVDEQNIRQGIFLVRATVDSRLRSHFLYVSHPRWLITWSYPVLCFCRFFFSFFCVLLGSKIGRTGAWRPLCVLCVCACVYSSGVSLFLFFFVVYFFCCLFYGSSPSVSRDGWRCVFTCLLCCRRGGGFVLSFLRVSTYIPGNDVPYFLDINIWTVRH